MVSGTHDSDPFFHNANAIYQKNGILHKNQILLLYGNLLKVEKGS